MWKRQKHCKTTQNTFLHVHTAYSIQFPNKLCQRLQKAGGDLTTRGLQDATPVHLLLWGSLELDGPLLIQLGPAAPCAGEESRFFAADGGHGPTSYGWTAIAVLHLHIDIISTSNNVSNSTDLLWHWNSVNPFPILNFCQPRAQRMQSAWQRC